MYTPHLILAKCQRLFARAWHDFYWHDFIVIQVKIERLPDCSAL
ncbi:hypothetical protein D051_3111 [Vibrio parahaemolyticus VPCR-2010]|nr:hypothetical protein D051_3111 [Vibrio parahaemolyticus VPCR-2010]